MEVAATTGAIRHAKLQSECQHQETKMQFLQAGCPSYGPTNNVQALKGKLSWCSGITNIIFAIHCSNQWYCAVSSSFRVVMHLPLGRTMQRVCCSTSVLTSRSACTRTTTLSAASPRWRSPRAVGSCSVAMMISTATSGIR